MTERLPQNHEDTPDDVMTIEEIEILELALQEARERAISKADKEAAERELEEARIAEEGRRQRAAMLKAARSVGRTSTSIKSDAPAFIQESTEPVLAPIIPVSFSEAEPAVAPPVKEWAIDDKDLPEKIIHRNLTIDGKEAHFDDTVPPEQRRLLVETAQNAGQDVQFNLVNPEDDYTTFTPDHMKELNNRLAQDESESRSDEPGYQPSGAVVVPMHGEEAPMESRRFRNKFNKLKFNEKKLKRAAIISSVGALTVAAAAGIGLSGKDDDATADASGSVQEAIDAAASPEIDVSNLITSCVEGEMGQPVHTQLVNVQGDVIWNVPSMEEGGVARPLNKLILDPKDHDGNPDTPDVTPVARYPKLSAPALELSTAVCAPEGAESIEVKGSEVHVDLAKLQSQIAFEATASEQLNVEVVPELILNAGVSQGVFGEEAKAALFADMNSPEVRLSVIQDALMKVGSKLINVENVPEGQASIADAIKAGLPDTLLSSLPQTAEGEPYKIVLNNNFSSPTSYIGIDGAVEGKYSLVNVEFVNQEADKNE